MKKTKKIPFQNTFSKKVCQNKNQKNTFSKKVYQNTKKNET